MKTKVLAWLFFLSVALLQAGCGRDSAVYLESAAPETEVVLRENSTDTETPAEQEAVPECCVYICGAVAQPGVYILPEGSRIYEVVELAGGFLPEAEPSAVNQAELICDGQMIWIPTVEEAATGVSGNVVDDSSQDDGRVNINTASVEELMTLPGIGQSKAESIVAYRTEHGSFGSAEELMNVEGIKEGVFNRVKDCVRVN